MQKGRSLELCYSIYKYFIIPSYCIINVSIKSNTNISTSHTIKTCLSGNFKLLIYLGYKDK